MIHNSFRTVSLEKHKLLPKTMVIVFKNGIEEIHVETITQRKDDGIITIIWKLTSLMAKIINWVMNGVKPKEI